MMIRVFEVDVCKSDHYVVLMRSNGWMDHFIKCARNNTYNFFFKRYFVTSLKHIFVIFFFLLHAAQVSVLIVCWVFCLPGWTCRVGVYVCCVRLNIVFPLFLYFLFYSEWTSTKNRTFGTKSFCKIFK